MVITPFDTAHWCIGAEELLVDGKVANLRVCIYALPTCLLMHSRLIELVVRNTPAGFVSFDTCSYFLCHLVPVHILRLIFMSNTQLSAQKLLGSF